MAKLDDDSVRELRRRASAGESRTSLGRAFGVSRQTASDIVDRKLWRHIE
jgi:DNA-binding XRE family transcriptional regulator